MLNAFKYVEGGNYVSADWKLTLKETNLEQYEYDHIVIWLSAHYEDRTVIWYTYVESISLNLGNLVVFVDYHESMSLIYLILTPLWNVCYIMIIDIICYLNLFYIYYN